ncbi:MAG: TlpA family protein disulfide reductase [Deltaproteobacteria bacterium]|nr:TlpA family protein disulfide reductase [Deltaproteobacteria bacterium]
MRRKLLILIPGLVLIAALIAVLAAGFGHDPHALPSMLDGKPAPGFSLQSLQGETYTLSELKGRKVLLNFWSTWCQPCKIEQPMLDYYAAQQGPDGVVFLGVLYGDEPEPAKAFLRRKGGEAYPNLYDPTGRIIVDYGVGGVPETYFINEEGVVTQKFAGLLPAKDLEAFLENTP